MGRLAVLALAAILAVAAAVVLATGVLGGSKAEQRPAVLWAVGDGADGSDQAEALARMIVSRRPDRFLYLGDVYGSRRFADGSAESYRDFYDESYGLLADRTAPTPGNHEWPTRNDGYYPYWQRVTGRRQPDYYAFELAGWEILSLNSEAPHDAPSSQVRWLAEQLGEPGTCRLAYWHRPRFSAGRHGDQPDVAPLWEALVGKAAIVVNGHDHDLQRLKPIDGIVELLAGAGGASRYALHADQRVAFGDDRTGGALRLELSPGRARYAFVAADGRRLDAGEVRCRPLEG